jgi:hypothetical protein
LGGRRYLTIRPFNDKPSSFFHKRILQEGSPGSRFG